MYIGQFFKKSAQNPNLCGTSVSLSIQPREREKACFMHLPSSPLYVEVSAFDKTIPLSLSNLVFGLSILATE